MLPLLLATFRAEQPDPMRLKIGRPGEVRVLPGETWDLRAGRIVGDPWVAASKSKWMFIGESHATPPHQAYEAAIVSNLDRIKRKLVVGVEFLQRPKQPVLDRWIAGELEEEAFLKEVDWKGQWGFDWAHYAPLFRVCKEKKIPMVALNVPRDLVRSVGRGGLSVLGERRGEFGNDYDLQVKDHRAVFSALLGGHPVTGTQGENMYSAQVLWDEGMADTALRWRAANDPNKERLFVIVAGSGHVMYGQGINLRIARRTGERGVNVVLARIPNKETPVSRGIADILVTTWDTAKLEPSDKE